MSKRPSTERANARLRRYLVGLHDLVDTAHADPKRYHPGVQCTDGCASAPKGCCSVMVLVERTEAEYIVARNQDAVRLALPKLIEQSRRIRTEMGDAIGQLFDANASSTDDASIATAAAYHALDMPCAFLSPERRCTIYRDRPLACRCHFVLSPPERCESIGPDLEHVTLDKGTRKTSQLMLLRQVAKERGAVGLGALPQMVVDVLAGEIRDRPVPAPLPDT